MSEEQLKSQHDYYEEWKKLTEFLKEQYGNPKDAFKNISKDENINKQLLHDALKESNIQIDTQKIFAAAQGDSIDLQKFTELWESTDNKLYEVDHKLKIENSKQTLKIMLDNPASQYEAKIPQPKILEKSTLGEISDILGKYVNKTAKREIPSRKFDDSYFANIKGGHKVQIDNLKIQHIELQGINDEEPQEHHALEFLKNSDKKQYSGGKRISYLKQYESKITPQKRNSAQITYESPKSFISSPGELKFTSTKSKKLSVSASQRLSRKQEFLKVHNLKHDLDSIMERAFHDTNASRYFSYSPQRQKQKGTLDNFFEQYQTKRQDNDIFRGLGINQRNRQQSYNPKIQQKVQNIRHIIDRMRPKGGVLPQPHRVNQSNIHIDNEAAQTQENSVVISS